jgi:hypothetical protein
MKNKNKQEAGQNSEVTSLENFAGYWGNLRFEHLVHLFHLADQLEEEYEWVEQSVGRVFSQGSAQKFYSFEGLDIRLQETVEVCGLCIDFNWKDWWDENSNYEQYPPVKLQELPPLTLCQILTVFVRMEQEQKGIILSKMQNKFLFGVIRAIQHHFQNKDL